MTRILLAVAWLLSACAAPPATFEGCTAGCEGRGGLAWVDFGLGVDDGVECLCGEDER